MLIADVNEFHPLTDAEAYKAGHAPDGTSYDVVILRATYSTTHVDNAYAESVAKARAAGVVVAHYGYLAAGDDPAAAGRFFGETVKAHGGADTAEGVYSGEAFRAAHLGGVPSSVHNWTAAYGQTTPPPGEELWQFTDKQEMPGVENPPCDCSVYTGTLDQYLATFGHEAIWCDDEEGGGDQSPRALAFLAAAHDVLTGTTPAPVPAPAPAPAPSSLPPARRNPFTPLAVDGKIGPLTIRARQFVDFGGRLQFCDGIDGPESKRQMQLRLGVVCDANVGPKTIAALQRRVGAKVDGLLGPDTISHLQAALNAGRY